MDYECVRCAFCRTGYEQRAVEQIHESGLAKAIFPTKVTRLRRKQGWEERRLPLLPGYIFIYSDNSIKCADFADIREVVRILRYPEEPEGVLRGADRKFADLMWARAGKIDVLEAVRVGERVEIVDGLFKAMNGRVVSMDKRKQIAKIELDVVGNVRNVWLSFDYLKERTGGGK